MDESIVAAAAWPIATSAIVSPDKAIDLMDEAGSRAPRGLVPPALKELEAKIEETIIEKEAAIKNEQFEQAASLRDLEQKLQAELEEKRQEWRKDQGRQEAVVTPEDIAAIVASWTGIPVTEIAEEDAVRLLNLEQVLHKRVVGQDEAISAISQAVRRAHAGLKDPKRPIGSFIFLGPTGVGKTELARALAEALFGDEDAVIRLDMSEYMERHAVARLIGSPPGYVGYDEGGQLTEQVRRKPYSIVLFDEIEKAHPEVFNILLQVLEDGRLTDSKGRVVDFRNTVIVMTSNVGAEQIRRESGIGFRTVVDERSDYLAMKDKVTEQLKRTFRPEFLNRIDEIVVFHALNKVHITQIAEIMLKELRQQLGEMDIELVVTDQAKELLANKGFDPDFGARPLRRAIQRYIENPLAEEILKGTFAEKGTITVDTKEGEFVFY